MEVKMKITIKIDKNEAKNIIKAHVVKQIPIDFTDKEIYVSNPYGDFTVEIVDKVEEVKNDG